jgi:hypothetical protein
MLAYGDPGDTQDIYMRMAEPTAIDCMYRFCMALVAMFGELYLRTPTVEGTARIMKCSKMISWDGRTVCLLDKECTKVTKELAPWYLR